MILYVYCIDLVTRIPKHIHFPFYDFSTIYYKFSKFQPNYTKKKKKNHKGQTLCAKAPTVSSNQPAGHQALFDTIHVSKRFTLGILEKFLLQSSSFFYLCIERVEGGVGEARGRPAAWAGSQGRWLGWGPLGCRQ